MSRGINVSIVWRVWQYFPGQLVHPETGFAGVAMQQLSSTLAITLLIHCLLCSRGGGCCCYKSPLSSGYVWVHYEIVLVEFHHIFVPLQRPPPPHLLLLVELSPNLLTNLLPRFLLLLPLLLVCLLAHALHLNLLFVVGCGMRRPLVCAGPSLRIGAGVVEHLLAHHLHFLALGAGKGH